MTSVVTTNREEQEGGIDRADLLYGVPAIAEFLGLRVRQVRHLVEMGKLPTFKMGTTVCARRSTLKAWLEEQDRAARGVS